MGLVKLPTRLGWIAVYTCLCISVGVAGGLDSGLSFLLGIFGQLEIVQSRTGTAMERKVVYISCVTNAFLLPTSLPFASGRWGLGADRITAIPV
jgi:hypothetical protein